MRKLLLFALLITFIGNAQIRQVKDIWAGTGSSDITYITEYNGKLYFSASNNTDGYELWSSDGTNVGTTLVKNINPSTSTNHAVRSSSPRYLTVANNLLLFNANLGTGGRQLFRSDGTEVGTFRITANQSNFTLSNGPNRFFGTSTKLYFRGEIASGPGVEPFISDGSQAGTLNLADLATTPNPESNPSDFTEFNNKVYFSALGDGVGFELFSTDGTTAGTSNAVNINTGGASSSPAELTVYNNKLFFAAKHDTFDREIFSVTTSNSLGLLKDINPTGGSDPSSITVIGTTLYFSADNGTDGKEIWTSNGFSFGTTMLKNINTQPGEGSIPDSYTSVGSNVFFTAFDMTNGRELWVTDGTSSGTVIVKNINSVGDSNPSDLTVYNGKLYFTATTNFLGTELWVSDGTSAGTFVVSNLNPGGASSNPTDLIVYNDELYFSATDGTDGIELWAYKDPTLSINDLDIHTQLKIYPNPVNDTFYIETNAQIDLVEILNINGQTVKSFNKTLTDYNIEELSTGMYFVKINSENGTITKKLIKE